uniref:Uncharacterized protein n=1 Tax=Peronospora matthiolae TaxID=2874970 RepID=A0AAV1T730_9STRA
MIFLAQTEDRDKFKSKLLLCARKRALQQDRWTVREVPDSISGKAQPLVQSLEHEDVKSEDRDKFKSKLLLVREVPDSISGKAQPLVQSLEHEDVKSGERGLVV